MWVTGGWNPPTFPMTLYISGKWGKHTHTDTGQDTTSASFSWHLVEGMSGLKAVVWHQHSNSDTIYHQPPNMETFITSWQENLVENNHLGFDNNLAVSFAPHLDTVPLAPCDFFFMLDLYTFIRHQNWFFQLDWFNKNDPRYLSRPWLMFEVILSPWV